MAPTGSRPGHPGCSGPSGSGVRDSANFQPRFTVGQVRQQEAVGRELLRPAWGDRGRGYSTSGIHIDSAVWEVFGRLKQGVGALASAGWQGLAAGRLKGRRTRPAARPRAAAERAAPSGSSGTAVVASLWTVTSTGTTTPLPSATAWTGDQGVRARPRPGSLRCSMESHSQGERGLSAGRGSIPPGPSSDEGRLSRACGGTRALRADVEGSHQPGTIRGPRPPRGPGVPARLPSAIRIGRGRAGPS